MREFRLLTGGSCLITLDFLSVIGYPGVDIQLGDCVPDFDLQKPQEGRPCGVMLAMLH